MMSFSRGSEWRKWDLHVHTKGTNKNDQFTSGSFDDFCNAMFKKAIENNVAVIGITDYFSIDNYKKIVSFIQNLESNISFQDEEKEKIRQIMLIPNVELRMLPSTGSGRLINIHCLFNPEYISKLDNDFFSAIEFSLGSRKFRMNREDFINLGKAMGETEDDLARQKGIDNFVVSHSELQKILAENAEFRKNTIIATSNKSTDGASGVQQHYDLFENEQASSLDATRQAIYKITDMIFSSNKSDIDYFLGLKNDSKEEVIKKCGSLKPCIHGSDAHTESKLFNPDNNRHCWLKANPTFEGLKQVINEPKDRVYIGETPPKLRLVHANKDKFIEKVEINKTVTSQLADKWFENTNPIPLNSDLIAIIGNKGNGKSALADIIALSGNVKLPDGDWFSFLNRKRFKDKSLASNFESKLTWMNSTGETVNLNSTIPEASIEKVKYLPQKYIEKICSEDEYNSFQDEINTVVFSHIKQEDRLEKHNLKDLIRIKTEVVSNVRENLLKDLKQLLQDNEDLKIKYSTTEQKKLQNQLAEKNQQIEDHNRNKEQIVEVKDPTTSEEVQGEIKIKFDESKEISNQIDKLQRELIEIQTLLNSESIKKNTIEIVAGEIDILNSQFLKAMEEKQSKLKEGGLEIDINKVFKIHYEKSILTEELEKVKKIISNNNDLKDKKQQEINTLLESKTKLDSELSEPQREFQDYLEKIKLWEVKNIELLGEKNIIEKEIDFCKTELPTKLSEHESIKIDLIEKIYNTYNRELEIFIELYSSVLEFVSQEKEKLGTESFIDFTTQITIDKNILINSLVAFFDGRRQQFKEEDLKELVAKYSDDTRLDNIKEMFTELISLIETDKRSLKQQFRDGKQLIDFYLELFGLKYLKVEYDILFDGKNIKQLSPGERGALLIIFYLLIDKGDIPLIIDQPEDNLDNESVFEYLVPYIKQAKKRRQIIIVTHNPNIAVVADAEQIIYTELDKANGNQIKYITGAIEDKQINKEIVKVLEGTMPAFDNRTIKYYRV